MMLEPLKTIIEQHAITIITGSICTGKSWLLNQYENDGFFIDNSDKAMEKGQADITIHQIEAAIESGKSFVCLDESQLYSPNQIVELSKRVIAKNRKVLIACQDEHNVPFSELFVVCKDEMVSVLAQVDLKGWDTERHQPESFSLKTLQVDLERL
ncbi:hypothetical protein L1D14_04135 [Vibrio tubiashii]|uniref:hypothetical protein n=1 Tax=Vibrio tubiashii TaxID=29498 RepID=UPI001EFEC1DC|nr:hypothetical protein [Vibrio tubiashii]MCG9575420.1 hypothetical protein [Vibrio tubiashii]